MDSRTPEVHSAPSEAFSPPAARGLGAREQLRLAAVALWCSFLGAILVLAELLTLLPAGADAPGLGEASVLFLCSWFLMLIPVSLTLALAPRAERP